MNRAFFALTFLFLSQFSIANSTDVFTYSTTSCLGTCPVYEVNVFSDGVIVFKGEAFTEKKGVFRLPKNSELFDQIIKLLDENNFSEFLDSYDGNEEVNPCKEEYTDHPSSTLTVQHSNSKKTVFHYHGCKGFDREQELIRLETTLFEMMGLNSYVGS